MSDLGIKVSTESGYNFLCLLDICYVGDNQINIRWKLKRKLAPKENSLDAAVAMKNKNGTLITDRTQLEKMYVEFYQDRMAPNQITPGLENLEHHKEELFNLRMILAEGRKVS